MDERRKNLILLLALFSLLGAWRVDTLLPSKFLVTSLYAIPILLCALYFRNRVVYIFTAVSFIIFTTQAFLEHQDITVLFFQELSIVIISILAIHLNRSRNKEIQLRASAEEARQQLEYLTHIVAHDIMQPITVSRLYADTLLRKLHKKGNEALLQKLIDSLTNIESLTDELREANRIGSGRMVLRFEQFDLAQLLRDTLIEEQITTNLHALQLDSPQYAFMTGDKGKLRRVIMNLLTNAIKYSPNGGTIKVKLKQTHNNILFSVEDNGIGLAEEEWREIFQPFTRKYKGKDEIKGTGLGLYICKSIIEKHGGNIGVTSEKGKGSIFYVNLPIK